MKRAMKTFGNAQKRAAAIALASVMAVNPFVTQTAFAYHQGESTTDVTELEEANAQLAQWIAAQGMVLLENENGALPLAEGSSVALFGAGVVYTLGNGDNRRGADTIYEGLVDAGFKVTTYNEEDLSRDYLKHYMDRDQGYMDATGRSGVEREISEAQMEAAKDEGNCTTAVYVISRTSGEGNDRTVTQGSYLLLPVEYSNLSRLAREFDHVIVVLNVGSVIDTNFFHGKSGVLEDMVKADLGRSTQFAVDEFIAYRDTEDGLYRQDAEGKYVKVEAEEAYDPAVTYFQYFDKYGWGADYYELSFVGIQKAYFTKSEGGEYEVVADNAAFDPEQTYFTRNVETRIDGLDSLLLMSLGGKRGGHALGQVLTGEIAPSGKLTDTWSISYDDYPSSAAFGDHDKNVVEEDYTDDIYVGYRYFDTFGIDVAYPFGYGLSYTDFSFTDLDVDADATTVTANVTVTNTGDYTGREVVEIYYSAPLAADDDTLAADLEIPYQELAAFAKTDELQPGQSQTLTISYPTREMASYSEKNAAYVMGAGDYVIRIGNSSRNTTPAAVISLAASVITEQLTNRMPIDEDIDLLSRADSEGTIGEDVSVSDAKAIALDASQIETVTSVYSDGKYFDTEAGMTVDDGKAEVPVYVTAGVTETQYLRGEDGTPGEVSYAYPRDITPATEADENGDMQTGENDPSDDIPVHYRETIVDVSAENATAESTLKDVADGVISLEAFVSTLTLDELSNIVMGRSVGRDTSSEYSVAGEAGETTAIYMEDRYITPVSMADGPEGLLLQEDATSVSYAENYQYCTYWSNGTEQAQTWDVDAIAQVGDAIGAEMERYGLALWLAPGINIHRNPLCGRNPQYYSEDPLIAGEFCAALTKTLQAHPGCGVTVKHMAGNSQETNRVEVNNSISERALREIYLKAFERSVREAQPMSIMTSYNANNGWAAADSYDMNNAMVHDEWGFKGLIMTDWNGGESTPVYSMHARNGLIMPGSQPNRISGAWGDGMLPTVDIRMVITDMNDYEFAEADEEGVVVQSTRFDTSRKDRNLHAMTCPLVDEGKYAYLDGCLPGSDERVSLEELMDAGIVWHKNGVYTAQLGSTVYLNLYLKQGDLSKSKTYGRVSLGDVQQCAMDVLNIVMNTSAFSDYLNKQTGTDQYTCEAWSNIYADILSDWIQVTKSDIA